MREDVLDAALELFARQGYAATTVRQLADAAGITSPAIYGHFESKRAIYDALMRRGGPAVAAAAVQRLLEAEKATDPEAFLTAAVRGVWEAWDTERERRFLSVALREGLDPSAGADLPLIADAVEEMTQRLGPVIDGWMATGAVAEQPVGGAHVAFELFGMVALIRILHCNESSPPAQRRLGRELVERHLQFLLGALLPPSARPPGLPETASPDPSPEEEHT